MNKLLIPLFLVLTGCASGSAVVTGERQPPTDPLTVQVMLEAPSADYDVIALVESKREVGFSRQGATDAALQELKKQAAKVGATAVVLTGNDREAHSTMIAAGTNSAGYTNFISGQDEYIVMRGTAISVAE